MPFLVASLLHLKRECYLKQYLDHLQKLEAAATSGAVVSPVRVPTAEQTACESSTVAAWLNSGSHQQSA